MDSQIFFDDVQVGDLLPVLTHRPTTRQLVMYAGASADYYEIHYDDRFAQANGLPGVVVQGALKTAFLGQLVGSWIGSEGRLLKLSARYQGVDVPNDILTCHGVVQSRWNHGDKHFVNCEVWIENSSGQQTTSGQALVSLPSRR